MLRHGSRVARVQWQARRQVAAAAEAVEAAEGARDADPPPEQQQQQRKPLVLDPLPPEQLARNAALVERLRGQLILVRRRCVLQIARS